MKKLSAAILLAAMSTAASASSIVNGGFESGFSGWNLDGNGAVVTNSSGYNATEGSNFAELTAYGKASQGLSWNAGQTLTFDWNFKAQDYLPFNDFSLFQVTDSGNNLLANITLANVASVGNYGSSGWNTFSYTFTNAGSGSVSFGVWNALDNALSSQLFIDNVQSSSVPEPAGLALLGLGLIGLGMSRKRAAK